MSMISQRYDRTATVYRQGLVSGSTIKRSFVEHLTDVACHIQPLEAELTAQMPGGFGKAWIMFCDIQDIDAGDKVTLAGSSEEFRVSAVDALDMGSSPHMEITIVAFANSI